MTPARGGGDRRLGVKGDAEPGGRQHRQIVGAVADRERLGERQAALGGERESVSRLVSPVTIGRRTVPAMRPPAMSSRLATTWSKPSSRRDRLGEDA